MVVYEYPIPDPLNGNGLAHEIEQATGIPCRVSVGESMFVVGEFADQAPVDAAVAAHAGDPDPEHADELAERVERAEQRVQARNVLAKAREVAAGNDTFTANQIQRLVARLVINLARERD